MAVDGRKIRDLREAENLTIEEFGLRVHASQTMISHVELGVKPPGVELFERIADYFGKPLDYFRKDESTA